MWKGFFDLDGPFNRIGTLIFDLIALNIIWFIFSIPIITIGASTTALFYATGKKVRKEDGYIFRDFWKSFKMNFKQSTIIWIIMLIMAFIIWFNLNNLWVFGNMQKFFVIFQYAILIQFIIIGIYIFPLLSRFYVTVPGVFKMSFIIGNRHILTTIICVALLVITVLLMLTIPMYFFMGVSVYAIASIYFIQKILVNYMPENQENKQE
ncbi:YesL family protein [Defluviitalea phaphyphila]|uniref:YesL family protein n=1 Tax=Defluviitalea phaphyphila TaxID=1473580 RepID=UPI000731B2F1|nr:YesL family protein [Defluviitalea phaphyphila]